MSFLSRLFGKKSVGDYSFKDATDWHSHILPGVDDGVQTMEESLAILNDYEAKGLRDLWLTPHIMEDVPNTPEALRERFEELKAAYKGSIRLHLAAENMLDELFMKRMKAGELMPIGERKDMLLVETSYFTPPSNFEALLDDIKKKGFFPLLAHPERYRYMDIDDYRRLHDNGVRFQLNILSLQGFYGPAARDKSRRLLKEGLYYCAGSDIHRHTQLAGVPHVEVSGS